MKARPATTLVLTLAVAGVGAVVGAVMQWRPTIARPALACAGEYADTLQPYLPANERPIARSTGEYTYLIRNSARYECPYYGPDGKLRKRPVDVREHGTAFAYEVEGDETYLVTNEHV
ncbi:MAG TPA: hypothetical protein VGG33_14565, partial [Polyangia bacterium]